MWDKVYAAVGPMKVQTEDGPLLDVVSFRMVAEINGRAYFATHVMLQTAYDDIQPGINVYGHILDEMVMVIEQQAADRPPIPQQWQGPV